MNINNMKGAQVLNAIKMYFKDKLESHRKIVEDLKAKGLESRADDLIERSLEIKELLEALNDKATLNDILAQYKNVNT